MGAECTSATLGSDGGVPSHSPWLHRVQVAFAKALGRGRPGLYVPAPHNTQWSGLLSDLQARTHDLAARGLGMARNGTYPLPDALRGTAQLFSSRRLVTAAPREMDRLYIQLAAPSVTFVRGWPGDDLAGLGLAPDRGGGAHKGPPVRSLGAHGSLNPHLNARGVPLRVLLAALQRVGGSHGPLRPGGASGCPDRLQGPVEVAGHDLDTGPCCVQEGGGTANDGPPSSRRQGRG